MQVAFLIKVLPRIAQVKRRRRTFAVGERVFLKAINDLQRIYEDGTCERLEIFSMEHILGCKARRAPARRGCPARSAGHLRF